MGTAAEMSKESRAALRSALKEQLTVVRKKVRTMRAKNLMGLKDESDEKEEPEHDDPGMADGKTGGGSDHAGRKGDRAGDEKATGGLPSEGKGETLSPDLKTEALNFFQKGNRPHTGKTKSVIASVMTNEQRSFARDSRPAPPKPKGGKKK